MPYTLAGIRAWQNCVSCLGKGEPWADFPTVSQQPAWGMQGMHRAEVQLPRLLRGLQSSTIWAAAESAPVEQCSKCGGKKTAWRWTEAILTVWELKRNEDKYFKAGLLLFYFLSSANDDPTLHLLGSDLTKPLLARIFLPFWWMFPPDNPSQYKNTVCLSSH